MTARCRKFIIVPACTDLNRGDQALVWESANLLYDAFGHETDIKIVDYGNSPVERARQSNQTKSAGYNVIRNLVENPKRSIQHDQQHLNLSAYLKVAATALIDFVKQLILLIFPFERVAKVTLRQKDKLESFSALKTSDGVIVKGGGFIHTYGHLQDPYYLWFNLYYVALALRMRKEVIFFPNSFGPVLGQVNRFILRSILNRCSLVYAREQISKRCLDDLGCEKAQATVDLAYYCDGSKAVASGVDMLTGSKPSIGITVRPYRFPESRRPDESYRKYIKAIADFCDSSSEFDIYFVVQVQGPSAHENDRIAIADVIAKCKRDDLNVIDGDYDYRDLISIYSKFDFLVGTRFHSVIFSQLSQVPSLAVAYGGNKTLGIMGDIGLSDYVVDINAITSDELKAKFNLLRENEQLYRRRLDDFMSGLTSSREQVIRDLRKVFDK